MSSLKLNLRYSFLVQCEPVAALVHHDAVYLESQTSSSVTEVNAFDQLLIPVMGKDWFRKVASSRGIHLSSVFAVTVVRSVSTATGIRWDSICTVTSENFNNHVKFETSHWIYVYVYKVLQNANNIFKTKSYMSLRSNF